LKAERVYAWTWVTFDLNFAFLALLLMELYAIDSDSCDSQEKNKDIIKKREMLGQIPTLITSPQRELILKEFLQMFYQTKGSVVKI